MLRRPALLLCVLCGCAPATARAQAGPPTQPACLPLAATSTGLIGVGQSIPSLGALTGAPGGFGPEATASLPDAVSLKTPTQTFSAEYAFVVRDGGIYVRRAELGRGLPGEPWHVLALPACLSGHVTEISADGRLLLALGEGRQLYSHDMPGGDLSADRWTWRWGPYFWTGAGLRIWPDTKAFATSDFGTDRWFTDSSGVERHPIGVASVYLLRGNAREITLIDPWLPNDDSRQVCGPRRGTTALAGLSGSGSTVFVVSRAGELWTRLHDFDISGANTVFGDFSWETDRPASDPRWQLPGPGWVRHWRPPGRFTDRITLLSTGLHSRDRLLRLAGRDRRGRAGYWEKSIDEPGRRAWTFVRASGVLGGRWLASRGNSRAFTPDDRSYAGTFGGAPAELRDFNLACSPAHLRVTLPGQPPLELLFHTGDGLRQETRANGLDDTPREYNGAIEVPAKTFAELPSGDPRRLWIERALGGKRFTVSPVAATTTRMRFLRQCSELTLGGRPARTDVPRVPPDAGAVVGRQTEAQKDGWTPSC